MRRNYVSLEDAYREHNDLYNDWKKASLEAERLAKINGDMCDTIAELEQEVNNAKDEREACDLARYAAEAELEAAQAALASTERQLADVGAELLAARPQLVPLKVRWDVTAEEALRVYAIAGKSIGGMQAAMDYLAAHAVIDAPAGVPTLEELAKIGIATAPNYWSEWASMNSLGRERMTGFAAAIRDAVLAGVREENNKVNELLSDAWQQLEELGVVPNSLIDEPAPQTVSTAQPTPEQVEALARVLHATWTKSRGLKSRWEDYDDGYQDSYLAEARAAFAHIQPERPKGLPSADQFNTHFASIDRGLFEHEVIELIYDFLAPWLRDPVGWELDVTSEEMYDKWNDFTCDEDRSFQAVLDLCRSRIRPVMECKECAGWKAHAAAIEDSSFDMIKRISAARAALEGK